MCGVCVVGRTCVLLISGVQGGTLEKKGQKGGMKEKEGELLPKTFQFPSVAEVNLLCQIPLPRVLFHELKCDFIRASVRLSLLIFHAEGK